MEHAKKRILIIDDEEGAGRLLMWNLQDTELYEVEAINSPLKALAAAQQFKPDLVLMDVVMPDINGGQLAKLFRDDRELREVPIVFLTAAEDKPEIIECEDWIAGKSYLAKPSPLSDVLRCLDGYLGQKE